MNIIERGRAFLQSLRELAGRSAWDWKHCPTCGSRLTIKNGGYLRRPWFLARTRDGAGATASVPRLHQVVRGAVGAAGARQLVRPGGAPRGGGSLAARGHVVAAHGRGAAFVAGAARALAVVAAVGCGGGRTLLSGRQYGTSLVGCGGAGGAGECAGPVAGHCAECRRGHGWPVGQTAGPAQRVVLLLADSVTGLLWPPVVAKGEESVGPWQRLFERAHAAGLDWDGLRGVTSDGAQGVLAFLRQTLAWVQHQRCVWHLWRNLAGALARAATQAAAARGQ